MFYPLRVWYYARYENVPTFRDFQCLQIIFIIFLTKCIVILKFKISKFIYYVDKILVPNN